MPLAIQGYVIGLKYNMLTCSSVREVSTDITRVPLGSTLSIGAFAVVIASGSQGIVMPWLWTTVGGFALALILLTVGLSWISGMRPKAVEKTRVGD